MNASKQVRSAERALSAGTWIITLGAMLFSVLTVTPLVDRVSLPGWGWTSPILPIVVDASVVIVVKLDSVISRLGGTSTGWSAVLRWLAGMSTWLLNIGDSALRGDLVGVGVHSVAPLLLIVTAEAGLAYRRSIGSALARIENEAARVTADAEAARKAEHEAARKADAEARRAAATQAEAERVAADTAAREAREHEEKMARLKIESDERNIREARQAEERKAQLKADEARAKADAIQAEALANQAEAARIVAESERRRRDEQAAADRALTEAANSVAEQRESALTHVRETGEPMPEEAALEEIRASLTEGRSQRQIADRIGRSQSWVARRVALADAA